MKTHVAIIAVLCTLYFSLIFPFAAYLKNRPFVEKLGYIPQADVMRLVTADQKQLVGEALILRTLMYFGGVINQIVVNRVQVSADLPGMKNSIESAVKLDPYNMDCYYFTQAVMVWDMKQVKEANALLEYGMKYRSWDWYLPFFLGFNYSYILKDYADAAKYYERVGQLTGNELSINLAGRYMYEAGQTDQAIAYLTAMVKTATNSSIKKSFETRLDAFRKVKLIEIARDTYRKKYRKLPTSINSLLTSGLLHQAPHDPYGGVFYLDEKGQVRTTSKFAYPVKKQ